MNRRRDDRISPSDALKVVGLSLYLCGLVLIGWLALAVYLVAQP